MTRELLHVFLNVIPKSVFNLRPAWNYVFMSFSGKVGKAFELFSDIVSLGGTYRIREIGKKLSQLWESYQLISGQLEEFSGRLASAVFAVQKRIFISERRLKRAERIIFPFGRPPCLPGSQGLTQIPNFPLSTGAQHGHQVWIGANSEAKKAVAAGAAVGTAATAGTWVAVHSLAHASTGTAIAGLHGIAAANASWAWLGGGSLAASGGGMALGHLVLPGIGTAVAVAVSATLSHSKAAELEKLCSELELANRSNLSTLSNTRSNLFKVNDLEVRLIREDETLAEAIRDAKRALYPLGYLSHVWRLLTYWFLGYYYKDYELHHVSRLGMAIERFIEAFKYG